MRKPRAMRFGASQKVETIPADEHFPPSVMISHYHVSTPEHVFVDTPRQARKLANWLTRWADWRESKAADPQPEGDE